MPQRSPSAYTYNLSLLTDISLYQTKVLQFPFCITQHSPQIKVCFFFFFFFFFSFFSLHPSSAVLFFLTH
ncbi:hypothetical protein CROQUDRAFT_520169 [Cronartium quercuum f. sp. fusiforme G11]|uniref:Uncharacterized protein n=1 Tax=Cronartium quercuum f. sp. fusiforme G11 TaxID=708437 RepID=A0A9P6TBL3_9BASI|nr:hypothetical protein CROQUDRAFT_520169 [Cronartium quercuum f. sp. fusiforme G11]